jgi:hypothetical protein
MSTEKVAKLFMLQGVQDWGQPRSERERAVADYVRAAGFDVEPSAVVVFGGVVTDFKGPDAEPAKEWLLNTLTAMPRGKFENEIEHLVSALNARAGA